MATDQTREAIDDVDSQELTSRRRRVEELILWGSLDRAREELLRIREGLLAVAGREIDLELIDRRIREVSELREIRDPRLREFLERGQFYFNNFEYQAAIRTWRSDPARQDEDSVRTRIAFAEGIVSRLESGVERVRRQLDEGEPERALEELARFRNLDPKRPRLWNLEQNARNLLNQKRVSSLMDEAEDLFKRGELDGAIAILSRITELSRHIAIVRWLKRTREEAAARILPRLDRALADGERSEAERLYRWLLRLNVEGLLDQNLERFRGAFAGLSLEPGGRTPPAGPFAESAHRIAWTSGSADGGFAGELGIVAGAPIPPPAMIGAAPAAGPAPALAAGAAAWPSRRRALRLRWAGIAAGGLLSLFALHEGINQVQLLGASRLLSSGSPEEATQALDSVRLLLFRRGAAETLLREATRGARLARADRSIRSGSWSAASDELRRAREEGRGGEGAEAAVDGELAVWRGEVKGRLARGSYREAWDSFDALDTAATSGSPSPARLGEARAFALEVGRELLAHGAYAEAALAARRLRVYPGAPAEALAFPGEVRREMLGAAREARSAGDVERSEGLLKLLESHFPESREDIAAERRETGLERASRSWQRALESGDPGQIDEALRSAEGHRPPGGFSPRERAVLSALQQFLAEERPQDPTATASVGRGLSPEALSEVISIVGRSYRNRLPQGEAEASGSLYGGGGLRGTWLLQREAVGTPGYVIRGRVALHGGDYSVPVGGLKVAILLLDEESRPAMGQLLKIPLLLPGASHEFRIQLPGEGWKFFQVALQVP